MNQTVNSVNASQLFSTKQIQANLSVAQLIEKIVRRNEGKLSDTGAISAVTGKYTGRSPKDRFIVKDNVSESVVDWGTINQAIDEESFDKLYDKVITHLRAKDEIFSFKGFAGADHTHRLP